MQSHNYVGHNYTPQDPELLAKRKKQLAATTHHIDNGFDGCSRVPGAWETELIRAISKVARDILVDK